MPAACRRTCRTAESCLFKPGSREPGPMGPFGGPCWTGAWPSGKNESSEVKILDEAAPTPAGGITLEESADHVTIRNGTQVVRIGKTPGPVLTSFQADGRDMLGPGSDLVLETPEGKLFYSSLTRALTVRILERGPERAVVETAGRMTAEDDTEMLDFRFRYTFRAGDPVVTVDHKMTNREAPELGVRLRRLWVDLPTTLGDRTVKQVRQMTHGANWWPRAVTIRENVELQAGSFVSPMARSVYGSSQDGKVVIRNFDSFGEKVGDYPHFLRPGNARADMSGGLKAAYSHLIVLKGDTGAVAWFPQMERHHPKGLAFCRGSWRFDIWPEWAEPLRLNRGMGREHTFCLAFQGSGATAEAMESVVFDHEVLSFGIFACGEPPVQAHFDPAYARQCRVLDLHRWLPHDEDRYLNVEIRLGTPSSRPVPQSRGELDLGDGVIRDCSGNNENDVILEQIRAYFRLGDPAFLAEALTSARHAAHVDFIAYDPDPLRQGTMAAHCPNHSDGATYPSHMWVGGLLAAFHVTGNPDFEEAALSVGANMRRWQTQRPEIFYCDSRECGWPMLAYVQLWHHTRDPRWLDYADEVFRAYRGMMTDSGEILHEIPHGLGTFLMGYGEFITWRACFFYYEACGKPEVKDFLVKCLSLPSVYRRTPSQCARGGWGCNDLFPAWAAYTLTGDDRFLKENHPFLKYLMSRDRFPWGGVDVHYFLNALHERGELERFCS